MTLVACVVGALAALTLVPASVLFAQIAFAMSKPGPRRIPQGERPRVAVLVPAHNEASVIGATLRTVAPQLKHDDRLLVVADNCTDRTATVAARAGASVVERHDTKRPGKTYALDFGVRELARDPPDVLIVVDADCAVETGAIDRLARECELHNRPVQALYLMHATGSEATAKVAAFAWIVKNQVRPLGMRRMGFACQLMGTGTAFPWKAIDSFGIVNSEMAEDCKLGIDMALGGFPALFCLEARVSSHFPSRRPVALTQRTRWEHGHLHLILREAPRLLAAALWRRDLQLFALAMDLIVPPLAFLALAVALLSAVSAALVMAGQVYWPIGISLTAAFLLSLSVMAAWIGWGRETLAWRSLPAIAVYALSKIPLYIRFLTKRQKVWIKTERD